jgi:hypothetical protein
MDTLITAIITMVATAITTELIHWRMPAWKSQLKSAVPKRKSIRQRLVMAIKYPFLFLSMCLIFKYMPFGHCFVAAFASSVLLTSFFIARDIFIHGMHRIVFLLEEERIKKDVNTWMDQLANCDRKEKERIGMIRDKLSELEKQRAEL